MWDEHVQNTLTTDELLLLQSVPSARLRVVPVPQGHLHPNQLTLKAGSLASALA